MEKKHTMISNKKIFITGASGFIGANLAHFFAQTNNQLFLFLREGSLNSWRIRNLLEKSNVTVIQGNLCEKAGLKVLDELQPEIILHNAAFGGYGFEQTETEKIVQTNLTGTINLVDALEDLDFECCLVSGSSSEYGIRKSPMKETDPMAPVGAYGVSKAAATLYAQAAAQKTQKKILIIRPFSVYGYYEDASRFIPHLILQYLEKTKNIFLRTPEAKRDFLFIEDVFSFYSHILDHLEKLSPGEILNMGSGRQFSILDVVNIFSKTFNWPFEIKKEKGTRREGDAFEMWQADISLAKQKTGWSPQFDLASGLQKTVAWFEKNVTVYQQKN